MRKSPLIKNRGWHKYTSFTWNIREGSPEYLMHKENIFQDTVNINIILVLILLQ